MKSIAKIFSTLLVILTAVSLANAQDLTVRSMAMEPMDLSASKYLRTDLNGKACALVKVQIPLEGMVFEGNVMGDVENKAGEYWVYLTAGTKFFKIKHRSVTPLFLTFADYGLDALSARTTYVLRLAAPASATTASSTQLLDPWIDYVETERNPLVEKLDPSEIQECKTPASVAYNFVNAILKKDYNAMLRFVNPEYKMTLKSTLDVICNGNVEKLFKYSFSEGKLGILSWTSVLNENDGYEVAVAYIQDESSYYNDGQWYSNFHQTIKEGKIYLPGETSPRKTMITKKIYITCSPSSEIGRRGFQDISRYGDTNVKVLVNYEDGEWKVTGFK